MVNKGSHFVDFVRFFSHTYTRTQQSLQPLWASIKPLLADEKKKRSGHNRAK